MVSKYGNTNVSAERSQFNEIGIIDINGIDVTSQVLNGESKTLTYFDYGTSLFSTQSFVCNGTFWTAYAGGITYVWFTGRAASPLGDLIFSNYYVGANDSGSIVLMTELSGGNYVSKEIIKGSNAGDIEVSHVRFVDPTLLSNSIYTSYSKFNGGSQVGTTQTVGLNATTSTISDIITFTNADGTYKIPSFSLYTEVDLTAAQIKTLFSVPVTLLPAPAVGTYYDIQKVYVEFSGGTVGFDTADKYLFFQYLPDYTPFANVSTNLIYGITDTKVAVLVPNGMIDAGLDVTMGWQEPSNAGGGFFLYTLGADSTVGDGTMKIKIYYSIQTFG